MNNKTESAERWKDNSVYKEVLATASGAAKDSLTLTDRLRALARAEHDDLSVGDEAADEIEELKNKILLRDTSIVQSMTMKSKMLTDLEELQMEIACEERRFNDLSDDYTALSKKNDKMREVLTELQQCSEYWSEYDVPLGIHDRIKEALKDDA